MNFEKIIITNPNDNYKTIAEIDASTSQEIDQKVQLAHQAFKSWSQKSIQERTSVLQRLLQQFELKKEAIATLIATEMGMPLSVCMNIDIQVGLTYFQGYLDNAPQWLASEVVFENHHEQHVVYFESIGVVAASIPWNFPFTNFIWAVIQNLVTGNTVIVKHSENCVLTAQLLEDIIASSDLPKGICNFVYGKGHDVGNYLINSDIHMIWFVGSVPTGHHIYQIAASKDIPVILELGGSAAAIVFEDIDIDTVVESIYQNRFANSGQSCDAIKRLIVHELIFDKIIQKLTAILKTKIVGSALDRKTDHGPLANKKQLETTLNQIDDAIKKGAKIIYGGYQPEKLLGAYLQPTIIIDISKSMKIWNEETFGPILPIVSFKTEEEAINLANDTSFGLGGYIYSLNKNRAQEVAKRLKTGSVSINGTNYNITQNPFGGHKKSGIGRTNGKIGMQSLCQTKVIAINKV